MSSTSGGIEHSEITLWPRYYWLYEHTKRQTVIKLPGPQAYIEVELMMKAGNAQCTHQGELEDCIHLEPASAADWRETHQ